MGGAGVDSSGIRLPLDERLKDDRQAESERPRSGRREG